MHIADDAQPAASRSTQSFKRVVASGAAAAAVSLRGPGPYEYLPKVPGFELTSATVHDGAPLPSAQLSKLLGVAGGEDISPQLSWSGFPKATKSFVVSMYDPQAPTGSGFWHWVVADIPTSVTELAEDAGAPDSKVLPAGAFQLGADAGARQYVGGAPPAGSGVHEYYLTVTALDVETACLEQSASAAFLGFATGGHTLARATLVCPTPAPTA
jgi:Raf kinase inhibitor-like YbhB/YbcL family protein